MRIAWKRAINSETAAVVVQSPNFFGVLEQIPRLASLAHTKGALLVVAITEGVSLGAVRPPVEADIVAMEGQSFGLPQSYGGPYAGVIATREKFVRQMPGRLAGETVDSHGKRGYVLTLATREQHIRREKATSNICTNQALCALAVNIHLCLLGKEGLKELAAQNLAKARFALEELEKIRGVRRAFSGPFFNEFVVEFPRSVKLVNAELLRHKIIGPLPHRKLLRGPDQARPVLRHGNDFARGNRTHGRSDPGYFVEADLDVVAPGIAAEGRRLADSAV